MLPVDDLDRAVAFYQDALQLKPIARFDPPGLAFFDLHGVRLLLEDGTTPSASVLYLAVDDVVAETERLRAAGVQITGEPHLIHRDDEGPSAAPASRSGCRSSRTLKETRSGCPSVACSD